MRNISYYEFIHETQNLTVTGINETIRDRAPAGRIDDFVAKG